MDLVLHSQTMNKDNINLQKNVSFNQIKCFYRFLAENIVAS